MSEKSEMIDGIKKENNALKRAANARVARTIKNTVNDLAMLVD